MERQFVRGFIDGALSVLGVVIGASAGQMDIIISAGIGGGVANGISNIFGALTAERVEEEREFRKIEKSMLVELRDTELYREVRRRVIVRGIVDGMSTILGSLVPVLPFIVAFFMGTGVQAALIASVSLTALSLGVIGIYYGRISRQNLMVSSAKMILMGLVTALISIGIERGVHVFVR
ncbi:MAG: TIGR00267 family protein [Archaeoglobi archaeon]|uniref:TIGR00267 family protein n=1 Tax=Geoglobus ahangari TaxID=113653 RepID=UPI0009FE7D96|nr:TIGR00267 family protein [Geoglobus ahangari]NOY10714.1 TIGR00267 family protein [Archaeoglobi archaeon]